jgi:hypothetical protein
MAEPDRPVAHPVFDIFGAIHIPHMAPRTPRNEAGGEHRILIIALGVGVRAAGDDMMGSLLEPAGIREGRIVKIHQISPIAYL